MRLTEANANSEINAYLEKTNSLESALPQDDVLTYLTTIKRQPTGSGPYPKVSLFEAANRIMSDIIILLGVRQLLRDPAIGGIYLPFKEYEVALGVAGGHDVIAKSDGRRLIGEAFNVARDYFPTKKSREVKKLNSDKEADYRLILFNSDAVSNPDHYVQISEPSMLYLPVSVETALSPLF